MKIIALSDLHNATHSLEALAKLLSSVDLILLVGDITNKGSVKNIADVIEFYLQVQQLDPGCSWELGRARG